MKKNFMIVFVTVLFAMISIATFNPILGPLARGLGLTVIESGSLVTITGICWIGGSFLWGKWARKGSRRLIMVSALLGYAASLAAFACIADAAQRQSIPPGYLYWMFLGLRAAAGFFFGAIPAMAQGYLMDWTTADNRASGMALFGAANGLGFVLGPTMGAALASISLTAPMNKLKWRRMRLQRKGGGLYGPDCGNDPVRGTAGLPVYAVPGSYRAVYSACGRPNEAGTRSQTIR